MPFIGIGVGIGRQRFASGGAPPVIAYLLLEDGGFLFQENGDKIIL
jgi:hypothetical protein